MEGLVITHNVSGHRFETARDNLTAFIHYEPFSGGLSIVSTQVPSSLEGLGFAGALTRHVLEYARSHGLKIRPICSYTVIYFRRHPEYGDLLIQ